MVVRICASVSGSSAEVASSSNNNLGLRHNARAMQTRCACPPLKAMSPAPPSSVSKPLGRDDTNSDTPAASAAQTTSLRLVPAGAPKAMLSCTVP
mmetsp:Transcript_101757/g.286987  ORF Transcript_101757/g.286987 Transcript_101757/m.286987 type:complete len:95 (-) Transcript_101757:2355-2639(-)